MPKEDGFLFHPLTQQDLALIWQKQTQLHTLSSEFDAFRLYAWLMLDHTHIAWWRNQFVLRFRLQNEPCYIAPYETQGFETLLPLLMDYERACGGKLFQYLCVERIPECFSSGFSATPRRDLFDYIYRAEDLITFQGHAFAAKRNQVAQFKRDYDWRFEPLSNRNHDACFEVIDQWYAAHEGTVLDAERTAINRMLSLPPVYGQSGGLLYAQGKPVAFAIGSHPRSELLDIIVEKALPNYRGVYSMIIQSYAAYAHSLATFDFINREEDMGLENLRNAKLQLNPALMIEKTLMTLAL